VHFISAGNDPARAQRLGAVGFLTKPVDAAQLQRAIRTLEESAGAALRRVLVVEANVALRESLRAMFLPGEARLELVATSEEALGHLRAQTIDCVVMNLALPDKEDGFAFLTRLHADARTATIPVIVHTALSLTADEVRQIEGEGRALVILQGTRSAERVIEETRLFLHRMRTGLPEVRQRMTEAVHGQEAVLEGKKILLVDDDMRNVYSLSSALRTKGIVVVAAADGVDALEVLAAHPDVSAVLMDIMMPRLDGHETIRRIRAQPQHARLPVIALTAKTMPGERQRCLDAGASDYIPKPVDLARLFSLLRVWLSG
jgi:CheY-like chemotaxis protein